VAVAVAGGAVRLSVCLKFEYSYLWKRNEVTSQYKCVDAVYFGHDKIAQDLLKRYVRFLEISKMA
jgi:hypothetical protein